jgi:hypothetical protein
LYFEALKPLKNQFLRNIDTIKIKDGTKTRKRDGSRPAEAEGICGKKSALFSESGKSLRNRAEVKKKI